MLIESFSKLPVNICVVGMSTLTLAYSYSKRLPYITGFYKGAVQWGTLLKKLKETLLMNATAGATIHVFYHDGNYLGKVIKPATVPFIPHGLLEPRPAINLPPSVSNTLNDDEKRVHLVGLKELEEKILDVFNGDKAKVK